MTIHTESQIEINVGVDVGKSKLDIVLHPLDLHFQIPNDEENILKVIHVLKKRNIKRIVVEATGHYGYAFVFACDQANFPIVVVNPISVRRYAQVIGILAKTDKVDANLIAHYAATIQPKIKPIEDKKSRLIKDLLVRRTQLLEMQTMGKNRLQILPKALHGSILPACAN
ncbi:transposase [Marinobacterium sp. BA1]|uniref:IS110 family transposase n=1 Tax=Marinobacterium sp. BA1 TaxID=3138931 RepID=UPI0032E7D883